MISTFDFQCLYMKLPLILPGLFALEGHPSTGHSTYFNICRKDTTYVSVPPLPTYTPQFCGMTIPCDLSMWRRREYSVISPPHSAQLTLVLFRFLNVAPTPVALLLYSVYPCCTQTNPDVHTIALVLPRFASKKLLTMAVRVVCTQIGFLPAIPTSCA